MADESEGFEQAGPELDLGIPPAVPASIGVRRWRKLPVEIEAAQFSIGTPVRSEADASFANGPELAAWCGGRYVPGEPGAEAHLVIETMEGPMMARPGWWVIKGVAGEFYPIAPDVFAATYEEA